MLHERFIITSEEEEEEKKSQEELVHFLKQNKMGIKGIKYELVLPTVTTHMEIELGISYFCIFKADMIETKMRLWTFTDLTQ